jgi:peptidoglycan/LPS O-acetylase OafA/YrhL
MAVALATISYHQIEKPSIAAGADVNRGIKRLALSLFGSRVSDSIDK